MAHEGSNGNTLQSVDPPEVYDEALPEVVQAPKITDESQSVPEQVGKDHIIPEVTEGKAGSTLEFTRSVISSNG
ncbi:hypothetical protein BHE90_005064 [Fusarium euwallaceae]|uniref:Uncharacterized protein n=1 Tax=Fusarium euwallaceae TaxID=1147111 RepID=A0A430LXK0_9HYPO|nr:hypothetical protein BHE90_005064 [Fusarium euwallaceae]